MPLMNITWDFTMSDGTVYRPGLRNVLPHHVSTAQSLGHVLLSDLPAEKEAPLQDVENRGSQTAEKTPPVKKTEKATAPKTKAPAKPNAALEKYNADVKRAKELGFTGNPNKKDVEDFLAAHDAREAALEAKAEEVENRGSQTPVG